MSVSDLNKITYEDQIDEAYRTLYYDDKTRKKREAALDFLKEKISVKADEMLKEIGVSEKMVSDIKNNERSVVESALNKLYETTDKTHLSKNKIKNFRILCDAGKGEEAYRELRVALIDKCLSETVKKTELYPSTWNRFLNNEVTTTADTVGKIEAVFNFSYNECEDFEKLILKDAFEITDGLTDMSITLFENTNLTLNRFLVDANLTASVWKNLKNHESPILQKTLLKLIVGFGADKETAEAYMQTAGSGFYTKLDIIFLACIACGFSDPFVVDATVERFRKKKLKSLNNPYNW